MPGVDRLAYLAELAEAQLAGVSHLILAGARAPVSFFAYPGRASDLVPADCSVTVLADSDQDVEMALEALAGQVAPETRPVLTEPAPRAAGAARAADRDQPGQHDRRVAARVRHRRRRGEHLGLRAAYGAGRRRAAAHPADPHRRRDRPGPAGRDRCGDRGPGPAGAVLEADGSALYTIQALWTQAREQLNVTTVLINNAAYAILRMELARTAAGPAGERASRMLDLSGPTPDFTQISTGLGVSATRVTTAGELDRALRLAYAEPGPHLIEAIVPAVVPPASGTAW